MGRFAKKEFVEIAGFQLLKRGGLTISELDWLEQAEQDYRLASGIPVKEFTLKLIEGGMSATEAATFVTGFSDLGQAEQLAAYAEYGDALNALSQAGDFIKAHVRRVANQAIIWRCSPEWLQSVAAELKEDLGIDLAGDWGEAHTAKLLDNQAQELFDFVRFERNGWAVLEPEILDAEVDLGENLPGSGPGDPETIDASISPSKQPESPTQPTTGTTLEMPIAG